MAYHEDENAETGRSAVGIRLRNAIAEARATNTEIAELTGVTLQAVTGWLRTGSIDRKHWGVICDRLGVTLDWLFLGKEPKHPFGVAEPGATYADPNIRRDLDEFAAATPSERRAALVIVRQLRDINDHPAAEDLE